MNLNILHINTNDLRGGAARVMMRLIERQNEIGHSSNALVGRKESDYRTVYPFDKKEKLDMKKLSLKKGYIDYDILGAFNLLENPFIQKADVIHLHNLHGGYFHPYALSMLSHIKPVVWTMHDMQAVTGHCSHSHDCDKWQKGCGNCPYPKEYPAIHFDRTKLNWIEKKDIYTRSKLLITPVGEWIGNIVKSSILNSHPIEVISNGIDITTYRQLDKNQMKKKYSIPKNRIIIGSVANGGTVEHSGKGGAYVQEVVQRLIQAGHDVLLVDVGGERQEFIDDYLYQVGYVSNEIEMAEVFNTFDLFLFPSLAETFGLVIAEAMACGVPVVTFETGGIPELVQHDETGFVAPQRDVEALYQYTERLVMDKDLRVSFGAAARSYCTTHFDHEIVTQKYLEVYEQAIENFEKRKDEILYFDLDHVPGVVKGQPSFLQAERLKGEQLVKSSVEKPVVAIVSDGKEELSEANVVFVKRQGVHIEDSYFNTMLYKGLCTQVLTSSVLLKRQNGKPFFNAITPVRETDSAIDSAIGGQFYSRAFFEVNKAAILAGDVLPCDSIELFSTESVSTFVDDYMKRKVDTPVYVYGAGKHTLELLEESPYLSSRVIGVIDKNPDLIGGQLLDRYEIIAVDDIYKDVPIIISSASFEDEIYEQLSQTVGNRLIKIYS